MTKCNEIMTKNPVCCLRDDSVAHVAKLMKDQDVGSIPVVENKLTKILLGIVTDRDLALKIVAEGRDPEVVKVEDVMTDDVVTCSTEDNLQIALDAMSDHQLRRIPVVDHENRIVGIIAQADIATHQPEKTAALVKEISQ